LLVLLVCLFVCLFASFFVVVDLNSIKTHIIESLSHQLYYIPYQ
jgi:hypothetical protein